MCACVVSIKHHLQLSNLLVVGVTATAVTAASLTATITAAAVTPAPSLLMFSGGVAAATSRHSSTTQLPTRSTPSGCMELSPLDPVVAGRCG